MSAPAAGEARRRARRLGEAAALFALTLLLYTSLQGAGHGVLSHPFLNWDDNFYLLENPLIRELTPENFKAWWTGAYFGNYAPLHLGSYAVEYALRGGPVAGGFHLTDAVLHAGSAVFALLLFRRLAGPGLPALLAAALFAFHPVQVESVAWASQRKSTLAMFFLLPALLLFLRHRDRSPAGTRGRWPTVSYLGALLFYLLSLLSKGMGVVLPVLLLLHEYLLDPRPRRSGRIAEIVPFFLLALGLGAATIWAQHGAGAVHVERQGAGVLLTMVVVFADYLRMLFLPLNLNNLYFPEMVGSPLEGGFLAALLLLAAVLGATALAVRRAPRLAFWSLWFFVSLGPVSNLLPLTVLKADRYLYLPSLALGGILAAALRPPAGERGERVGRESGWQSRQGAFAVAAVALCMALLTWHRVPVWGSDRALWTDSVAKAPRSHIAWGSLGETYFGEGNYPKALEAYEKAVALEPRYGRGFFNIGFIRVREGALAEAAEVFRKGLAVSPEPPIWNPGVRESYGFIHFYIAVQEAAEGKLAEAESRYRRSLGYRPVFPEAEFNLGLALAGQGRQAEAFRAFRGAASVKEGFYEAHREAGLAALRGGAGPEEARYELEKALALRPEGADAPSLRRLLADLEAGQKSHSE
ncbi:MAG: tetratricopeptide repeat protein [Deltaproteobacteria bacterium]|nr:tetratricopeptide repeat protein [Deltaproteobacteria bacterium]